MKTSMKSLLAGLILPGLLFVGSAAAAEYKERSVKFAFQNVKEHPQGQGAQKFADIVEAKSGGKIKVKLFPGGTLGGDVQTVSALQGGIVEMSVMNAGILVSQAKEFALVDLPFLFNSGAEVDALLDGPVGEQLMAKLPEKGLVGLGFWDLGFRNLTNNRRPVKTAADIAGLKIRVIQTPIYIDIFKSLGANPVPLAFPELYGALETGTVDGQENPAKTIELTKFNEVQKYMTITRHIYNPQSLLISKKFWDTLNADEKALFQSAAAEATVFQRKLSRDQETDALASLKAKGMTINELPADELTKIREKVKPVVDKYKADIGEALVSQAYATIEKKRASN
ncbi:TRAP transporter substrate-binding protein [Azospirillum sp. BE72]|uniref:TRAP transporter substrate-binding protein n=1 Tax=Azospirillum sp. BE72 TaxID=2817776 RepID=UPI0028574A58|nr:TRAP transporter substrate-binding protein [Azospirillum sp. BE72]MDR6775311.1 tripartite ATP-independent transporter DctP family solute receptor [Azospirillum sp. BE72]